MNRTHANNGLIVTLANGQIFVAETPLPSEAMVVFLGEYAEKLAKEVETLTKKNKDLKSEIELLEAKEKAEPKDVLKFQDPTRHLYAVSEAERLLSQGHKVSAIKVYQAATGYGLKATIDELKSWIHLKTVREWK